MSVDVPTGEIQAHPALAEERNRWSLLLGHLRECSAEKSSLPTSGWTRSVRRAFRPASSRGTSWKPMGRWERPVGPVERARPSVSPGDLTQARYHERASRRRGVSGASPTAAHLQQRLAALQACYDAVLAQRDGDIRRSRVPRYLEQERDLLGGESVADGSSASDCACGGPTGRSRRT